MKLRCCALTTLALIAGVIPTISQACSPQPPMVQEPNESNEAFQLRKEKREAASSPRAVQQSRWDNADSVSVVRIEKIRIDGVEFPKQESHSPVEVSTGQIPPPIPVQPLILNFGQRYEAQIKILSLLKGISKEPNGWHWVGGVNSCGGSEDGSLAWARPGDEMIVFADWASIYTMVDDELSKSRELRFFGIRREDIVNEALLAALAMASTQKSDRVE